MNTTETKDPRLEWTAVGGGHVSTIGLPAGSLGGCFEVAFLVDDGISHEERFDDRRDAASYHDHLVTGLASWFIPEDARQVCGDTSVHRTGRWPRS